jgi:U3 small nucleolar RNA-associated protein 21
VLQVLRLGTPVTSFSLAPSMDMLATTHVEREGVYLWANQLVYGSGADIIPSEKPIEARLPSIKTGFSLLDEAAAAGGGSGSRKKGGRVGLRGLSADVVSMLRHSGGNVAPAGNELDEELSASDDDEDTLGGAGGNNDNEDEEEFSSGSEMGDSENEEDLNTNDTAARAVGAGVSAGAAYKKKDSVGAPVPLAPEMVTLSLLPRTQWLNLVHLDTIKERNKPIEAPQKPKSAPFFLPTLTLEANAGRNPVFDASVGLLDLENEAGEATKAAAAAAWGDGEDEGSPDSSDKEDGDGATTTTTASRVLRAGQKGFKGPTRRSRLVELLHSCSDAGDFTSLMGHFRSLTPTEVDRELRSMQLLDEATPEEERDVELLFTFLEAEAASNANFEFTQALLRASLMVHGEAVAGRPAVAAAAARVEARLSVTWQRLNTTLQHVRCMVGLLGSLQT